MLDRVATIPPIIDIILAQVDANTLATLRATCQTLHFAVKSIILDHIFINIYTHRDRDIDAIPDARVVTLDAPPIAKDKDIKRVIDRLVNMRGLEMLFVQDTMLSRISTLGTFPSVTSLQVSWDDDSESTFEPTFSVSRMFPSLTHFCVRPGWGWGGIEEVSLHDLYALDKRIACHYDTLRHGRIMRRCTLCVFREGLEDEEAEQYWDEWHRPERTPW